MGTAIDLGKSECDATNILLVLLNVTARAEMSDTYAVVDKSKKKRVKATQPNTQKPATGSMYATVDSRLAPYEIIDSTYDLLGPENIYYNTEHTSVNTAEVAALYESASSPTYSKLRRGQAPQEIAVPQEPSITPTDYSRLDYHQQNKSQPPESNRGDFRKPPFCMLTCLVVLAVAVIAAIVGVVVAIVLIATLKSDMESLGTGSLESRFNQLDNEITNFITTSQMMLTELSGSTSNRVNSLEGDITAASDLATDLPRLLNGTVEKFSALQDQLTIKIGDLSANIANQTMSIGSITSSEADRVIRATEGIVNSSAIQLATDIRALYVFESCDVVRGLRFTFPSGTYRIGPSQDNYSLMNCSTSTALTCNGISGQWRRVAYLDTRQANIECPGNLQAANNSCRIFGSNPICSPVFFPSGGIPYSQVCGRIYGRYSGSPDAFDTFTDVRPDFPTINDNYVDGVSLSYGMNPRNHVWTLAATIPQNTRQDRCASCDYLVPDFVGSDYSCQIVPVCSSLSDDSTCRLVEVWNDDNQCNGNNIFYRNLTQTTTENLEMRLCRDQVRSDEDISISFIEIFVSAP